MIQKSVFFILIFCSQSVFAQYYAQSHIVGYVPTGIGKVLPLFSKNTAPHTIHAVKHNDGKVYRVKHVYPDKAVMVTAQNECIVRPTENDPTFLGRSTDGSFDELAVSYLKFRCTRQ